jgi:hypothetical protein
MRQKFYTGSSTVRSSIFGKLLLTSVPLIGVTLASADFLLSRYTAGTRALAGSAADGAVSSCYRAHIGFESAEESAPGDRLQDCRQASGHVPATRPRVHPADIAGCETEHIIGAASG